MAPPFRHDDEVMDIVFLQKERWVATAGQDGTARVWDPFTGKAVTPPIRLDGKAFAIEPSSDGLAAVVGGEMGGLRILRLDDLQLRERWDAGDLCLMGEVLAGQRIHEGGDITNLTSDEWLERWQRYRERFAGGLSSLRASGGILDLHRERSEESEEAVERPAGLSHVSYGSIDAMLLAPEVLVPEGARWRFFRGTREPSAGLEWTAPEFDDGSWEEGPSGFGYGDDDDATVLADMRNVYTTVYVRHRFDVPRLGPSTIFTLSVRADDGFVAYLNGQEVGRGLAGKPGERLPFDGVATDNAPEPTEATGIHLEEAILKPGANVLALQGLNQSRESSDFSLIPVVTSRGPIDPDRAGARFADFRAWTPETRFVDYLDARLLQAAGRPAEAIPRLENVLAADKTCPEPYLRLAECRRALGDLDGAEGILRQGLEAGGVPETNSRGAEPLWDSWFTICAVERGRSVAEILAAFPSIPESVRETRGHDIRWALEALRTGGAIRLNSGGEEFRGTGGRVWGRDRFYSSGAYRHFGDGMGGAQEPFTAEIAGTDDDPLYRTERWFPRSGTRPFGYRIPLPLGRYRVTLHFAEIWFKNPGERVFDVLIEGEKKLEAHDPVRAGFAAADRKSFEVSVGDGWLDIELLHGPGDPKLSAIEAEKID
jgi:hypothetical protein